MSQKTLQKIATLKKQRNKLTDQKNHIGWKINDLKIKRLHIKYGKMTMDEIGAMWDGLDWDERRDILDEEPGNLSGMEESDRNAGLSAGTMLNDVCEKDWEDAIYSEYEVDEFFEQYCKK